MNHLILICITLGLLIGCSNEVTQTNQERSKVEHKATVDTVNNLFQSLKSNRFVLDTIPERNTPDALDLSKAQLFIDTTRNSAFHQHLTNWHAHQYTNNAVASYLQLEKCAKAKQVNFGAFPTLFIKIRQFEDGFLLYDRCDGIDPRYELRDSTFVMYGSLEASAKSIHRLIAKNENHIKLVLHTLRTLSLDAYSTLEITKTQYPYIYQLQHRNEHFELKEFVIPFEAATNFNILVNHCPNVKLHEYEPFH